MDAKKPHNPAYDTVGEGQPRVDAESWSEDQSNGLPDVGQALHSVPGGDVDTTGPGGEMLAWDRTGESELETEAPSTAGARKSNDDLPKGG